METKLDKFASNVENNRKKYLREKVLFGIWLVTSSIFCLGIFGTLWLPIVLSTVVSLTPMGYAIALALMASGIWMLGRGVMELIQSFKEWQDPSLASKNDSQKRISLMTVGEYTIYAATILLGLARFAEYVFDELPWRLFQSSWEAIYLITNPLFVVGLVALIGGALLFTAGYFYHRHKNATSEKALSNDEPEPLLKEGVVQKQQNTFSLGNFFSNLFGYLPRDKFKGTNEPLTEKQLNNVKSFQS